MANEVYANGREIACKAAAGKTVAAFPDVCLSPPSPPAGPVPLPYPNTAYASDTTNGSTTVKISDKEIMLKDKSVFKKSTGNEAATKSLGMGVVTHTIQGEASFTMWSMDVKAEGSNVDRHLDTTIHNEQCFPSNTGPWPYVDAAAFGAGGACENERKREKDACDGQPDPCPPEGKPKSAADADALADKVAANACLEAKRCKLVPYSPSGCCEGQTPHHLVEASSFFDVGRGGSETLKDSDKNPIGYRTSIPLKGTDGYNSNKAPCICVEGTNQHHGTHGLMHTFQGTAAQNNSKPMTLTFDCAAVDLSQASKGGIPQIATNLDERGFHKHKHAMRDGKVVPVEAERVERGTTYGQARDQGVAAAKTVFPDSNCSEECLKAQLDNYHKQPGVDVQDDTRIRSCEEGHLGQDAVDAARAEIGRRSQISKAAKAGAPTASPPGV